MSGRTMGQVYCTGGTIPYKPSIFDIQGANAPLCPRKTHRDKILAANAGRPIRPSKQRGSSNVWVVNNYQRLSEPLNV